MGIHLLLRGYVHGHDGHDGHDGHLLSVHDRGRGHGRDRDCDHGNGYSFPITILLPQTFKFTRVS